VSFSNPPPAAGVRVHWNELPGRVRDAIEERIGGRVVEAVTQPGGFSPGLAARLLLEDGRRVFVKAVSESANPDSPAMHRREAQVVAAMPVGTPVPRLHWTYNDDGWVVLGFEDVDGRHPTLPWQEDDLDLVVRSLQELSALLTPSPIESPTASSRFARNIQGWKRALVRNEDRLDPWALRNLERLAELEALAPTAAAGETLLHFDTRADNLLIAQGRVYVVDWPSACIGAAWVDWVGMAPSVAMQAGPHPQAFLDRFHIEGASSAEIDAVLCSLAGYFVVGALDPPPPGLPTVRAFQAAQGEVALAWLRERLGWA
jgi:aminoglycoside phosphotransferase (APT) family kinase protein